MAKRPSPPSAPSLPAELPVIALMRSLIDPSRSTGLEAYAMVKWLNGRAQLFQAHTALEAMRTAWPSGIQSMQLHVERVEWTKDQDSHHIRVSNLAPDSAHTRSLMEDWLRDMGAHWKFDDDVSRSALFVKGMPGIFNKLFGKREMTSKHDLPNVRDLLTPEEQSLSSTWTLDEALPASPKAPLRNRM